MNNTHHSNADILDACATYLTDLQELLRQHCTEEEWQTLFERFDTPERLAGILQDRVADVRSRAANFWIMLDLSTDHLRRGDHELLTDYRGPDSDGQRDRDPGQSLFVTPCVGGWIVSTSGCLAPAPDHRLPSAAKALLDEARNEIISHVRSEGFSDEFVAIFRYAYEHGVTDIRFHADADYLPGFPRFDLGTDQRENEDEPDPAPAFGWGVM